MDELLDLKQRLEQERPTPWAELSDLALYMDQIISYMPRQLIHFDDGEVLTSAMVNNYIKDGLVPRADGKRYGPVHLGYLTAVCALKKVLSVRDTGVGISAEEKERIFGAFERLDNARGIPGFGLGLAITARLVSEMRGRVEVKSVPGEGSRFSVFLPVPSAGQSAPLEEKVFPACEPPGGIRVLVMDDDRIQLEITREMLSRSRIHCDCCTDVRELMDCLKRQEYDLLLTDIQMPGADGFSVLELLRDSNIPRAREIPAIAVTAHSGREEEYLSAGFAGCIHKPFSAERLVTAIMGA